jgi:hypothetical protein
MGARCRRADGLEPAAQLALIGLDMPTAPRPRRCIARTPATGETATALNHREHQRPLDPAEVAKKCLRACTDGCGARR